MHAERLLRGIGRYARDILFISIDVNTIMKYDKNSIVELKKIIKKYHCIDKVELLPFKKICPSSSSLGTE